MCGIAGVIYSHTNFSKDHDVKKMLATIQHRGPDDSGTCYTERLAMGQQRLAIVDLSRDGRQPMAFLNRYKIIFNGEIYNYIELRKELKQQGYVFVTHTDTEVIMAAYDLWGENSLHHFNGMWAFMLYDQVEGKVFCARDRFGVKPFYYYKTDGLIAIASEIKEFTVLADWKPVGNVARITDFLINSGLHDYCNETLFQGVYQLRPGEKMSYDLVTNRQKIETWYDLSSQQKETSLSLEEAAAKFKELFEDSVRLRLRSDVKVGSCLSGGLDSSSIVCVMSNILREENKEGIQEVVFAENHVGKYDESKYAEDVVAATNVVKHTVYPSFQEILDKLDDIVWHQDEPFGSTSIIAQWDVYEKAHQEGLTVMLDGQGADEYLAGYTSFQRAYFRELLVTFQWKKLYRSLKRYKEKYRNYYIPPYNDLRDTVIGFLLPANQMEGLKRRIKHLMKRKDRTDFIIDYDKKVDKRLVKVNKRNTSVQSETVSEMMYTSLPKLVHHQDRNAMAHSIESRAPFLDYRLVEFVYSLPGEYKVNLAVTKYVMRNAMKGTIPDTICERMDKLGFATPESVWIRENSQQFRVILEESCDMLSNIVSKENIMSEFERQVHGKMEFDGIFWCIVCAAHWVKVFDVSLTT